jgi:hypothetical protein
VGLLLVAEDDLETLMTQDEKGRGLGRAYGFPLYQEGPWGIVGICVDETGKTLGHWTSSDMRFLESDLKNHAKGYDYQFYKTLPPDLAEKLGVVVHKESP